MVSIRFGTLAGVADLQWTVDERGAASPPQHLDPNCLAVAGADLAELARIQMAFVAAILRRTGWLAPLLVGIAARLLERAR